MTNGNWIFDSSGNPLHFGPDGNLVPYRLGAPVQTLLGIPVSMDGGDGFSVADHTPLVAPTERIKVIRAGVGNTVRMIPVADVVCFEATEKYVNVVTPSGEALVRMSLRELTARIDSTDFIQVHRSVLVNSNAILSATRDEIGHYSLAVRGLQRPLKVSRAFGHLFRPM